MFRTLQGSATENIRMYWSSVSKNIITELRDGIKVIGNVIKVYYVIHCAYEYNRIKIYSDSFLSFCRLCAGSYKYNEACFSQFV